MLIISPLGRLSEASSRPAWTTEEDHISNTPTSANTNISILRDLERMAMIGCRILAGQLDPMSDKLTTSKTVAPVTASP